MVLRGSAVSPPSLTDAENTLNEAEEKLKRAREELEIAKKSVLMTLDDETVSKLTHEELVELVQKLRTHVVVLENREKAAGKFFFEKQVEVQKALGSFACGGAAGAIARSTVAPMDRIKILMQTSHLKGAAAEAKYSSILNTAREVVKSEGLTGLWRGNFTNCIRVVPHTAIQFSSYEKFKKFLIGDEKVTVPMRLTAGALSGMTAATFTHPMDVIRIRLQTQPELRGFKDAFRSVAQENGFRSFYKGYTPAMLSLSPFIAINFASFDTLKTMYFGENSKLTKKQLQERNPAVILGLGAAAGIFAQTCCYPLDTVRRRMQMAGTHYTSTINAFSTIMKQEGPTGFYKGMSANALKVVPNNAIRFAAYEILKSYFFSEDQVRKQTVWRSQARSSSSRPTPVNVAPNASVA